MQDINVLVVFYSRTGRTEKIGLAAALGAVQARANIRLRWLREATDNESIQADPVWKENHERMEKEYIAPRPIDAEWADVVMIGASGAPPELKAYLSSLDGKVETVFISPENALIQGRQVTESVRAKKMGTLPQSPSSD